MPHRHGLLSQTRVPSVNLFSLILTSLMAFLISTLLRPLNFSWTFFSPTHHGPLNPLASFPNPPLQSDINCLYNIPKPCLHQYSFLRVLNPFSSSLIPPPPFTFSPPSFLTSSDAVSTQPVWLPTTRPRRTLPTHLLRLRRKGGYGGPDETRRSDRRRERSCNLRRKY